jgi:hypothetical protein
MGFFDYIKVRNPVGFFDKLGNLVEDWLHFKGLGHVYKINKKGQTRTIEQSAKCSDYFINAIKGFSHLVLLPITLGCMVFREVRRNQELAKKIKEVGQKTIYRHPYIDSDAGLIIANPYKLMQNHCIIKMGTDNTHIRIHSLEAEKTFIGNLKDKLKKNEKVRIHVILGSETQLLEALGQHFVVTYPSFRGKPRSNVFEVSLK